MEYFEHSHQFLCWMLNFGIGFIQNHANINKNCLRVCICVCICAFYKLFAILIKRLQHSNIENYHTTKLFIIWSCVILSFELCSISVYLCGYNLFVCIYLCCLFRCDNVVFCNQHINVD